MHGQTRRPQERPCGHHNSLHQQQISVVAKAVEYDDLELVGVQLLYLNLIIRNLSDKVKVAMLTMCRAVMSVARIVDSGLLAYTHVHYNPSQIR